MKTLISLENFVQRQKEKFLRNEISKEECLYSIFDFANNIQQQPQLNHLIPCVEKDGKWVVLENPKNKIYPASMSYNKQIQDEIEEFESASKNVLFDGWELIENDQENQYFVIKKINENVWITFSWDAVKLETISIDEQRIESYSDLTKYNLPLTDNGEIYFNIKS